LTEFGDSNLRLSILAEASQQEQKAGQSFLTGIEKLVNQILLVSDVPCQQICHEHIGKLVFPVKHFHHGLFVDLHHRAIGHCARGAQAESLSCEASFSEEISLVQNAYGGFLPALRHNCESYLSFPYIKNSVGRVALNKDRLLFGKGCDLPTAVDGRKERLGIELTEVPGHSH
jgi:hypothetical protein